MKTYNDIYLEARKKLRAAGIDAFGLEAWLIMSHVTGKTREEFAKTSGLYVKEDTVEVEVEQMLARRIKGEPVAYIVGEWEFYGIPVTVNEAVLIPRVDTEILAGEAIRILKNMGGSPRVLDMCAGSGCVGLAIAKNVPACRVLLADKYASALKVCRANMIKNRLTRNVTAIQADALEKPPALLGTLDLIVSNPPYIKTNDLKTLDESVRDYEPVFALDGGEDGLQFFRAVSAEWKALLKPGAFMAFECGINQADMVAAIMKDSGFTEIYTKQDTLEIERVVVGRLSKEEE